MRVLHILNELRPSGAEVMLKVAAPYWKRLGVQAEILSNGQQVGAYATALRAAGYPIHHLPFGRASRFLLQYDRFLRRHPYDAVHVHTEHANFWLAGLARLRGIPRVVRTVHNVFAFEGVTLLERRVQRRLLRRFGVQHVSIGPSVEQAEQAYFHNSTTLIPNWYDTEHFVPASPEQRRRARAALEIDDGAFVIASVGNCSHIKNHTALIEALATLPPRLSFTYLHVGEEDAQQSERQLAAQLDISNHVRFLGFVHDVPRVLHAADAFVMPSLHEGYPISAIEAMGMGIPVILADTPGLRDLGALSGQIAWVAPRPDAIARGIMEIAALSPEQRAHLGSTLHRAAHATHGPECAVRAYVDLYRGALPDADVTAFTRHVLR